jgi:hypothetical protein
MQEQKLKVKLSISIDGLSIRHQHKTNYLVGSYVTYLLGAFRV